MNESTLARDAALELVEGGADVRATESALQAVESIAKTTLHFTTDDVVPLCSMSFDEPRAWGAVMRRAQKRGYCEPTPHYRQSSSRVCHARPKRVWKSRYYSAK